MLNPERLFEFLLQLSRDFLAAPRGASLLRLQERGPGRLRAVADDDDPVAPRRKQAAVLRQPHRIGCEAEPADLVQRHLLGFSSDLDRAVERALDARFPFGKQWQAAARRGEQGSLHFTGEGRVDRGVERGAGELLFTLFGLVAPRGLSADEAEVLVDRSLEIVVARGVDLNGNPLAVHDDARRDTRSPSPIVECEEVVPRAVRRVPQRQHARLVPREQHGVARGVGRDFRRHGHEGSLHILRDRLGLLSVRSSWAARRGEHQAHQRGGQTSRMPGNTHDSPPSEDFLMIRQIHPARQPADPEARCGQGQNRTGRAHHQQRCRLARLTPEATAPGECPGATRGLATSGTRVSAAGCGSRRSG